MMLQEKGLVSLNDKFRDLALEVKFNNKWETTDSVRLVNLLDHTAEFDDFHAVEYTPNAKGWTTLQDL